MKNARERVVRAALRYYRKAMKQGYARYGLCISRERASLFRACAVLERKR